MKFLFWLTLIGMAYGQTGEAPHRLPYITIENPVHAPYLIMVCANGDWGGCHIYSDGVPLISSDVAPEPQFVTNLDPRSVLLSSPHDYAPTTLQPRWVNHHTKAQTMTFPASDTLYWECPKGTEMYLRANSSTMMLSTESPQETAKRKRETKPICVEVSGN